MLGRTRKTTTLFVTLAAGGALALTACGGDGSGSGKASGAKAPAAPSASSSGQPGAQGGADSMDLTLRSGTARQNNAPRMTGDWANPPGKPASRSVQRSWVQLSASRAGNLDPVVVNGAGFTLYRFDKDTASPSKSTCAGACATTWPPVLVNPGGKVFVDGVRPSDVGVVARADGTRQITVGGWPVYRFSKDLKPGDTNGQGVGGTWFGVAPNGQKAGQRGGGAETGGGQQGGPATSAILFDEPNFSDDGPSQGVAGRGCQNVARPKVTSSVSADGSLQLWSGRNCTGQSKTIKGSVADLSRIGFDNKLSSVRFG
ncbi:hypothetical protein GCM10018785_19670 [Streptomyces longispororuber]|uniref:Lipoprotein n=1 Tax=Streptomyces longispororuber TaxID=68230 RepID=A0A918ZFB1_9ACTN|nr:hypothetical protein [Streptomyces longispororuber]GHE50128.1 hypothetical protein GCM10018785_19670 [Streptomyces longispororuber]